MIQIDRDMPKSCVECFAYSSICSRCGLTGTAMRRFVDGYNNRLKNCPLKEVSEEQEEND